MHFFIRLLACAALAVPSGLWAQDAPLAKLITVAPMDSGMSRTFFGRVAARETVDLAFQVSGQIVEFPAVEGEPVPKGGLIAQLDLEPFQLSLDQARAQADQANRTLERLERLQGSSVSEVTVQDARTQAELNAIALRNAQRALDQATLTAPFDALVAARNAATFATINAGTPVVRLHDMSELRIEIDVPEILFQQAGEDPDVVLSATFPASDRQFPVTPREFNAETSGVGQTFRITLGLPPPEGLVVLPGSSVTVAAQIMGEAPMLVVPASALTTANDGTAHVMVFEPTGADEGTVRRTPVTIQPTARGAVSVTSGLSAGQEIVASGAARLEDGATVRRFGGF